MDARTHKMYEAAVGAACYREFLKGTFGAIAETSRAGKFNYAAFARKAGFTSRGFAQEVLSGRKRLTTQSYPKFVKALALPVMLKPYFSLLVAKEEPELNGDGLTETQIEENLKKLKERIKAELKLANREGTVAQVMFRHNHLLSIYSVLAKGATLEEISRRTSIHPATVERVLEHLVVQQVVEERSGRYHSVNPLLVFKGLPGDHPVRSTFLDTVEEMKKRATSQFEQHLFLHAYFSVDRARLPELKKRLWDLMTEFVDQNGNDDGDGVAKMVLSLFH